MRNLTLSTTGADVNELEQLQALIGNAPERGYTLDQVRIGVKVLEKLAATQDGGLSLEDAEWHFVCERLKNASWRIAAPGIVGFVDKVLNAAPE